jgi:hypothetical protein
MYRVKLLKINPGQRLVGQLLDPEDIAQARKLGTTGFVDLTQEQNDKIAQVKNIHQFHPEIVYFRGIEFVPD